MSDDDTISELEARLDWYQERGWTNAIEDTQEQIAELTETVEVKTDLTSDGEDALDADEELAEHKEALQWYEERGWDGPAEAVREQIKSVESEDE